MSVPVMPGGSGPPDSVLVRADGRLVCPRCAAPFRPDLTAGRCPVCRTPAPGAAERPARALDSTVLLVGLATVANLVLLAVLAVLVLRG